MSSDDQTGRPAEPTSRRVSSSSKRASVARRRAIVGGVAAIVLAGGAVALFAGGDEILDVVPGVDPGPETPDFAFDVKRVTVETTSETKAAELQKAAKDASKGVARTLDGLYFRGFVESDTWGDFGEIEALFDERAQAQAETDLDTTTLGEAGAEAYTFVEPGDGSLAIEFLADGSDRPVQAIATVRFDGTAEGDDGTFTQVRSAGTFFLHRGDGGWTIYAYRVDRTDRPAKDPSATASASSSAGATVSPEGDS